MSPDASLAQLVEHALRKRMVVGSIPTGGFFAVGGHAHVCSEAGKDSAAPGMQ